MRSRLSIAFLFLLVITASGFSQSEPARALERDGDIPVRNWAVNLESLQVRQPEYPSIVASAVPSAASHFITITPCRVVDTRGFGFSGAYGPPILAPSESRNFVIGGQCGIPATASAVSFNFTVAEMSSSGNLTVHPAGATPPTVSTINWTGNTFVIANGAIVPLGAGAAITVVNQSASSTHLILDVNGYTAEGVVTSLTAASGLTSSASSGDVTLSVATDGITAAQLAPNSVEASEIAANAVGISEMADNSIGAAELADNSVDAAAIQGGAVAGSEIANFAVTSLELATMTVRESAGVLIPGGAAENGSYDIATQDADCSTGERIIAWGVRWEPTPSSTSDEELIISRVTFGSPTNPNFVRIAAGNDSGTDYTFYAQALCLAP